ncbi:hypothetical protein Dimus_011226 [Dionaea muscipula]
MAEDTNRESTVDHPVMSGTATSSDGSRRQGQCRQTPSRSQTSPPDSNRGRPEFATAAFSPSLSRKLPSLSSPPVTEMAAASLRLPLPRSAVVHRQVRQRERLREGKGNLLYPTRPRRRPPCTSSLAVEPELPTSSRLCYRYFSKEQMGHAMEAEQKFRDFGFHLIK